MKERFVAFSVILFASAIFVRIGWTTATWKYEAELDAAQRSAKNAAVYDCRSVEECERYAKTMSHATGRIFTRCLCDCELSERWREGCEACYFIEVPKGE